MYAKMRSVLCLLALVGMSVAAPTDGYGKETSSVDTYGKEAPPPTYPSSYPSYPAKKPHKGSYKEGSYKEDSYKTDDNKEDSDDDDSNMMDSLLARDGDDGYEKPSKYGYSGSSGGPYKTTGSGYKGGSPYKGNGKDGGSESDGSVSNVGLVNVDNNNILNDVANHDNIADGNTIL
jgi:hypothetical protein